MSTASVVLTYALSRAIHAGIDSLLASTIITAFGGGAITGRFLTGGVANAARTNRLLYYSLSTCTLAGAILVLATIFAEGQMYIYVAIYSLYGLSIGK